MRIGVDITQSIYEGTGVAEYVNRLVEVLLRLDKRNEYILFYSHPRYKIQNSKFKLSNANVEIRRFRFPIKFLELLWNKLHVAPIEWFIGDVDVFYTSDWVEPPTKKARKITTIHDISVLKVPETFDRHIVSVHKKKLEWVKKESDMILCDSETTKQDVHALLGIENDRLRVVYPGIM